MTVGYPDLTTDRRRLPTVAGAVIAAIVAAVGMVAAAAPVAAQSGGSPAAVRASWVEAVGPHAVSVGWYPGTPGADSYTVTSRPSGRSCTTTGRSCVIDGLVDARHHFTIEATNAHGTTSSSVRDVFFPSLVKIPSLQTTVRQDIYLPIDIDVHEDAEVTITASGGRLMSAPGNAVSDVEQLEPGHLLLKGARSSMRTSLRVAVFWRAPDAPGEHTIFVTARLPYGPVLAGVATMTVEPAETVGSTAAGRAAAGGPLVGGAAFNRSLIGGADRPVDAADRPVVSSAPPPPIAHLGHPVATATPVRPVDVDGFDGVRAAVVTSLLAGGLALLLMGRRRSER